MRAGSTLADMYEQEMDIPQGSALSPVLFRLKVNDIVNSVFKDLEAPLYVDEFAQGIRAKPLPTGG